jgi:hypothetical protein
MNTLETVWKSADEPPYDGRELWSREVFALTLSRDVFKICYFLGSDGESGVWQRTKEMAALGNMGKVIAWMEIPSLSEVCL